jgi:kynurenine formamidase
MMELLDLELLARDDVYTFCFVVAPIRLRGATGSPVRPLAVPLRS